MEKKERGHGMLSRSLFQTESETWEGRYEWYAQMRKESPISFDEKANLWDIFSYKDIHEVLLKPNLFSSERKDKNIPTSNSIIAMDPPKHTRMRALVNQAFTPRMVQSWEEKIGSLVDRLLEKVDNTKSFDLINTLAYPLPLTVIAHLIGVHQEDLEMFRSWTLQIVGAPENNTPEAIQKNTERIHNGFKNLSQYFSDIIKEKREKPQDDIISVLLSAEVEGNKLKDEDIVAFSCLLLIAGHETTTNLIGNSLFCFLDDERRHWAYLKQNPTQIDAALEEVLRFRSPVQALPRTVKEDTKIGDIHFSAGDQLVLWIGSANRDEKQFPHANQFLIDRSPNQHLAFGKGIHFCLGAPLSKLEVKVVLLKLLHRFPSLQIERYKPLQSPLMYGLKEFYVSV